MKPLTILAILILPACTKKNELEYGCHELELQARTHALTAPETDTLRQWQADQLRRYCGVSL